MNLVLQLEELGLSAAESAVLVALYEKGPSSAGAVSKSAQVNRTTSYEALDRLMEKGFITYTVKANRRAYKVLDPTFFVRYFEEQHRKAEVLAEQFSSLRAPEEEAFEVFEGRKGIKAILNDILQHKSYCAYGSSGKFMDYMQPDFVQFQRRKKELNIRSKVLQTAVSEELQAVAHAQFRIMPEPVDSPVTTIIYGNYVVIVIWSHTPHALRIRSAVVQKQFQNQFNALWEISAPLKR